ncbi:hypothetical protein NQ830_12525 [Clostridioides difficile]|uniref:hypothetical protein n=1 Tax=Clostridioides difficile TaxID=1496 RepID=UPI00038D02AE|nr:hypothetical protein [Clostridioides difficile]EQJ88719.1 hypothetical protein QUC_3375 [Clostridioides difficile P50]MCE4884018.1 hypothetical protein [Clostridioides difficile]MCO8835310.1 hypothetical protein [Clostridioides difficile]MCP3278138.1 hypothetical protein [Clostridioides difficile]MCR1410158.1 hypothetical protein [Clostridioides difficile]
MIISAWQNNNSKKVLIEVKKDKKNIDVLIAYTNKIKGKDMTMIQSWILEEVNNTKNNGYGIYELI